MLQIITDYKKFTNEEAKDFPIKQIGKICFCLSVEKFVSGNDMYKAQSSRWSSKAWIRRDPASYEVQANIIEQVKNLNIPIPKSVYCYECLAVFFKSKLDWTVYNGLKLKKRDDLTNLWKPVEDGIVRALGLDDCQCVDQRQIKGFLRMTNGVNPTPPYFLAVEMTFYCRL